MEWTIQVYSCFTFTCTFNYSVPTQFQQEAQLSQRGLAMLRVTEYFAKSLKVTEGHSKWRHSTDRIRVPTSIP